MEAIVERCCGLDVHQATVVACILVGSAGPKPRKEVRSYGTTTRELLELRDWLAEEGCTQVGMESTGVYWMPVYAVLEDQFELVVGNAHQIRNVPGRKTDVKDSEWIADLLRHGLISKSFVPPKPIRELRACFVTDARSSRLGPPNAIAGSSCWRQRTSSSRASSATCSGYRACSCCELSSMARPRPSKWPSWRAASCAKRRAARPGAGGSRRGTPPLHSASATSATRTCRRRCRRARGADRAEARTLCQAARAAQGDPRSGAHSCRHDHPSWAPT